MVRAALVLLAGVVPHTARAAFSTEHPVASVITLLQKLQGQAEQEGQSEALAYQKFEYWCATSTKTLDQTIEKEKSDLESLADVIDSHEKNIEVLGSQIDGLTAELADIAAASAAATSQREAGKGLYDEESAALAATITAIGEAITALETAQTNTDSFVQQRVQNVLALLGTDIDSHQQQILSQFTDPTPEPLKAAGDYDDHVKTYSFKSGSVIELLKNLKLKFENQQVQTNKEETNALNAFSLAEDGREDVTNANAASKSAKENEKTSSEGALGTAQSQHSSISGDLSADKTTLDQTEQTCRVKQTEWEERSATRSGEIGAIKAAIKIMAKVTGVRTEPPSNPIPPASPVGDLSLLQQGGSPRVQKAVQLLKQEAAIVHSKAIAQLAQQLLRREEGPFDEVVNMIQKMIFRLMNEQKEEDDHKNWCDLELSKTAAAIQDKSDKLTELGLKINAATARASSLASEIEDAETMIADITSHVREATEIRATGKEENALALKDAQDAQVALANAMAVLTEFYKSSGEVAKEKWEFLQRAHAPVTLPEDPSTWDSGYTGVADPKSQPDGILSLLERVSADFASMESNTAAQEASDETLFEADMKDNAVEKARRVKEVEMKGQERKRVLDNLRSLETRHKGVSKDKEATEQYEKDLQPACVEGDSTYDDRKDARDKEVVALKEAQTLLQGAFDNSTNTSSAGDAGAEAPTETPISSGIKFLNVRPHRF